MADDLRHLRELANQPDGDVTYIPICEQSVADPVHPRFVFGHFSDAVKKQYYSKAYCGPVGLYDTTNIGLFESSLLVWRDGVLQCDEIRVDRAYISKVLPRYHATSGTMQTKIVDGPCALLLGRGYKVWGHWLVDILPKLFILTQAGYDLMALKYLVPGDTPDFGLGILGITKERRVTYDQQSDRVCAERLLIPTFARTDNRPSPVFKDAIGFATSLIWSRHSKPAAPDEMTRIFVSRGRLDTEYRRNLLLNREAIEQLATAAGFNVVHPEQMPLLEQFALFANARQIIGDYGSALHTSVFSDPTTTVCVLRPNRPMPGVGFVQSVIAEALDQPTGYVFADTDTDDQDGSFTISQDTFENCLAQIFPRPFAR